MRVILADIPTGMIETNQMARYLNSALQKYNDDLVQEILVKEHAVTLPAGKTFSLGLLYLAAVLRNNGHDVVYVIVDNDNARNQIANEVKKAGAILLSCKTTTYMQALSISRMVKEINPKIITVFGGAHPTALPYEVAREATVDFVSVGEGEETIKELIAALEYGASVEQVAGLVYRDKVNQAIVRTGSRALCNLNDVPEPAYDLLPGGIAGYHIYVETGRGCLHNCSFCANPVIWQRKVRRFSPERVYSRLKKLADELPKNTLIHIVDPAFGFMKEDMELCQMLIEHPLSLKFSCDMCAMNVNQQVIEVLYRAGFVMFCVGIENCDSGVLKKNRKPATLEMIENACRIIRNCTDALIKTYWIVGLPGENEETARKNRNQIIEMLKTQLFDICCEHIFVPYPGCSVYEDPDSYNYRIFHKDWKYYDARSFPLPGESEYFSMESAFISFLDLLRAQCELYNLRDSYDRKNVDSNTDVIGFSEYKKKFV